jgi:hypothetical protein
VGDGVWSGAAGEGDFGVAIHQILFDWGHVGIRLFCILCCDGPGCDQNGDECESAQ